jgi:hypothetical protein
MQSFDVSGSGFFEAGTGYVDTVIAPNLGTSNTEITILPQGTSVGSKGFISQIKTFEYAPGGSVGDVMGFTFAGKGEGVPVVEGTVLFNSSVSTSGVGTAINLGSASGRILYSNLHVTATSGTGDTQLLNVYIESDATSSFGSAATRVTFTTAATAVTSEWASSTASSSTDSWWRVRYVSDGVNEGFTFTVTAGISYL